MLGYRASELSNDPVPAIPGWEMFVASLAVLLVGAWVIEIPELIAVRKRKLPEEEVSR